MSHNMHFIASVCDELFIVDEGTVRVRKTPITSAAAGAAGGSGVGGAHGDAEDDAASRRAKFMDVLEDYLQTAERQTS